MNQFDMNSYLSMSNDNIANALFRTLSTDDSWRYCFLDKGGDGNETYLSSIELLDKSLAFAKKITTTIPHSSPIILAFDHGVDLTICLLACLFSGNTVVVAPVPRPGATFLRFKSLYEACNSAVVITQDKHSDLLSNFFQSESDRQIIQVLNFEKLDKLTPQYSTEQLRGFKLTVDDTVILQFTSGSTSTPKGISISSCNILANQAKIADSWQCKPGSTYLFWLPLYHDMGLFGMLAQLLSGLKVVQMDPLQFSKKPIRWLRAISKFKVYCSGGPPFAYALCNELEPEQIPNDLNLSHWKIAFCGADFVPAAVLAKFRDKFKPMHLNYNSVIPVYGLAEATLFVAGQPSQSCEQFICSSNKTEGCYLGAGNSSVRIFEVEGKKELPQGEIGEICFEGKSVAKGYVGATFHTGSFLRTGDLGYVENDYLYICDRIKDVIIYNGISLSPSSIEQSASSVHSAINSSAVAAFQDVNGIHLLIEVRNSKQQITLDYSALKSQIRDEVRRQTGVFLSTIKFLRRGQLMRTTSGKIQRKKIAIHFEKGHEFREVESVNSM